MALNFESLTEATSGAIGALVSTTVLYPLDICKTKYQAEARSRHQQRYRFPFFLSFLGFQFHASSLPNSCWFWFCAQLNSLLLLLCGVVWFRSDLSKFVLCLIEWTRRSCMNCSNIFFADFNFEGSEVGSVTAYLRIRDLFSLHHTKFTPLFFLIYPTQFIQFHITITQAKDGRMRCTKSPSNPWCKIKAALHCVGRVVEVFKK